MGTTGGKKDAATTGSGHKSIGGPEPSLLAGGPPPPGAFPVVGNTEGAQGSDSAVTIGGSEVIVEGSKLSVDPPGNGGAMGGPGTTVNSSQSQLGGVKKSTDGSSNSKADSKKISTTGSSTAGMTPSGEGPDEGPATLVKAGGGGMGDGASGDAKKKKKKPTTAGGPVAADKDKADGEGGGEAGAQDGEGKTVDQTNSETRGDPVTVATGYVIDDTTDVSLPGLIPLVFRRLYSSARFKEITSLGRGGWTHSLEQWIEVGEAVYRVRNEVGHTTSYEKVPRGGSDYHRQQKRTLHVDMQGRLSVVDHVARRTLYFGEPDKAGRARLRYIRDSHQNQVELRYEGDRLVRALDTAGRVLEIRWGDRFIRRLEVWSAGAQPILLQWVDFRHDVTDELLCATDALGGKTHYRYDGHHRLIQRQLSTGIRFHYTYDDDTGRCILTEGDNGLYRTKLSFDLAARKTYVSGNAEPRIYTWNKQGLILREANAAKTYVIAREYDDDHNVTREENAAGEGADFEYDARGHLIKYVDPAGNVTEWTIEDDLPIARKDADGLGVAFQYDQHGKLIGYRDRLGLSYWLGYDGRGRLLELNGPDGRIAGFQYDDQHNVSAHMDARGAVTELRYDAMGRPAVRKDALGRVTRVEYDRLGRAITLHMPDGTTTRAEYDARGRLTKHIDPLGQERIFVYDGLHALRELTEPTGQKWRFETDRLERLTCITNPRFETYQYEYDEVGRVTQEQSFSGRRIKYRYGSHQRLLAIDYDNETFRRLDYDLLGNVIQESSSNGAARFKRDGLGRLLAAVLDDPYGKVVTEFERDRFGRVVAETQNQRTTKYAFDARGRRASRTLWNGETTQYAYDADGLFSGIDHDGYRVALERDVLGRESRRYAYAGEVDQRFAYDAMDRLVDQAVSAASLAADGVRRALSRRQWQYDALGRATAIHDSRWGSTYYAYDPISQLIQAVRGATTEIFDYDPTGSLRNALGTLSTNSTPRERWEIRPGNQLVTTATHDYENDGQGRRVRKVERATGAETKYYWDCRDRLREVFLPDGRRVRFIYDAFGRRVRKEVLPAERRDVETAFRLALTGTEEQKKKLTESEITDYVWDGNTLAAEIRSEDRGGDRTFVHEPGTFVPMLQKERGEVLSVVTDHLGMPKELVDEKGRIAWAAAHSAWGGVVETHSDPRAKQGIESPFRLLGQVWDADVGLGSTRFRWFDVECGRWLSPDPLGFEGGRNLQAFDGAPSVDVDPWGLTTAPRRKPPHEAVWQLNDAEGREIASGYEVSGGSTPGRRLTWQEQGQQHTETKILAKTEQMSVPGGTLIIYGREPPCRPNCRPAMQRAADERRITIIYMTDDPVPWTFSPRNNQGSK
jgi:RHS repeat-associated protein